MLRRLIPLLLLLTLGVVSASGSFSVVIDPLALSVDANLEQGIGEVEGWTIYAGTGFSASPAGVVKLQPYTLLCQAWDVLVAGAEVCAEVRAPIIGPGSIIRVFISVAW